MKKEQKKAIFYGVLAVITLVGSIFNIRYLALTFLLVGITTLYILLHIKHCKENRFNYDGVIEKKIKEKFNDYKEKKKTEKEEKKKAYEAYENLQESIQNKFEELEADFNEYESDDIEDIENE